MDIDLEDYQVLAIQTFRNLLTHESSPERVREVGETGGFDSRLWSRFAALGGASLSLADECGGGGGSLLDAVLIGVECGRRVAPLPYAESVVALRSVAEAAGGLPAELAGDTLAVLGHPGTVQRHADGTVTARAEWVRGGTVARYLVLSTEASLAVIDLTSTGVVRTPLPNLGRLPLALIELNTVAPRALYDQTQEQAERAAAELWLLRASELVGAGRAALMMAQQYVVTRRQFGRSIGSFQAIQHRMADCLTALDAAELLLWRAGSYAEDVGLLRYYGAVALIQAKRASELAARESLQFFGGYGFTLEYDAHLFLRFVKTLGVLAADSGAQSTAMVSPLRKRTQDGASWTSG